MIRSFKDKLTEDLFHGRPSKRVKKLDNALLRVAVRKLDMLHAAHRLDDLRVPPGNRLEGLHGDLEGFHSIRVNQPWRLIFRWEPGGAAHVQLVDCH